MIPDDFKRIRLAAGLSQEKLAAMIGKSRRIIVYYENGKTPIPFLVERFMLELERTHDHH